MYSPETLMLLIVALPLLSAIVTASLGRYVLRGQSHLPAVAAVLTSFALSVLLLDAVQLDLDHAPAPGAKTVRVGYEKILPSLWTWANISGVYDFPLAGGTTPVDFSVEIALRVDPLTAIMLVMVTFVASLVVIYSTGYMQGDPGYWRFFSYLSLFVFSMVMLVSVSNFLLLYVFWEAVGVCSYLLIGFWYKKPEAAAAGKKAFLVNRIGDFGFALGVFLIWTTYGTLNFHDTQITHEFSVNGASGLTQVWPGVLGQSRLAAGDYAHDATTLAICLLLFVGACGKSAQFPLHVWLPDAMEGPTPVSALIHAATMVTAGVYLVTRCTPLFMAAPVAQLVVSGIGCATALMAGFIAITQTDLKRVLAYSTVSQLGFMFLALGTGSTAGIIAGMFHLFTHAFFKALLFLGAGSVMHAMGGVIDMREFGGLRHRLPTTHWTFLFGCLALAGVVPFAGFWSKDAILAAVHDYHGGSYDAAYECMYYLGMLAAMMTAFYTFRAFFLTFYGPERIPVEAGGHAHESPPSMTMPLIVLAVCALIVGAYLELGHGFAHFIRETPSLAYDASWHPAGQVLPANVQTGQAVPQADGASHLAVAILSTIAALLGIGLAACLYLRGLLSVAVLARWMGPLYPLSREKLYFDQVYLVLFVWPLKFLASACYVVDRLIVDGVVNLTGLLPPALGSRLRALQIGLVQFYALAMVLGLLVLLGTLLKWPPV